MPVETKRHPKQPDSENGDLCLVAPPSSGGSHVKGAIVMPQLASKGITRVGIVSGRAAKDGLAIGKRGQAMMIFFNLPTHVLVSGEWQCRGKRMACALATPVSIRTKPFADWAAGYVCYKDASEFPDLSGTPADFDASPLVQAIRGLHAEARCDSEHALLHHWIELIHGYVTSFVRPRCGDERILRAWKTIATDLRRDWSVEEMAATAMMSAEHFRRLCLKNLGHSPMMHLSRLRVERAGELLRGTDLKIETICEDVGYEYRSTFSNVFTKFMGMRPSAYRETATGAARR